MAVQVELHAQTETLPSTDSTLSYHGHNFHLTIAQFERVPSWIGPVMTKLDEVLARQRLLPPSERRNVDPRAIEFGLDFLLSHVPDDVPVPWVVPVRDGGIQFEWHDHGIDLEVELTRDGRVLAAFEDEQNRESAWEAEVVGDLQPIRRAIATLQLRGTSRSIS